MEEFLRSEVHAAVESALGEEIGVLDQKLSTLWSQAGVEDAPREAVSALVVDVLTRHVLRKCEHGEGLFDVSGALVQALGAAAGGKKRRRETTPEPEPPNPFGESAVPGERHELLECHLRGGKLKGAAYDDEGHLKSLYMVYPNAAYPRNRIDFVARRISYSCPQNREDRRKFIAAAKATDVVHVVAVLPGHATSNCFRVKCTVESVSDSLCALAY